MLFKMVIKMLFKMLKNKGCLKYKDLLEIQEKYKNT